MPALTRRRDRHANQEAWLIYYGDVHVGTLSLRSGNPTTTEPWGWRCGFYPGSEPGDASSGTAATFWEARTAFEAAWRIFLAKRTEADFQAWRDQRDRTARKYALWDAGRCLPRPEWEPGKPCDTWMRCRCGVIFDAISSRTPSCTSRTSVPVELGTDVPLLPRVDAAIGWGGLSHLSR
jgi:hypothetical protein